eukprot:TRINITY_DN550_c0_g1_i2.p1 TRINITY_DN550_c0_g1~~TRINITY_DN550_c0_g1_i2.p1  ORF type:complete len:119 (-),score=23.30 TRINITY_DN550_c0_g1_i2:114-470(-)
MFERYIAVYKHCADVFFYIISSTEENELIVSSVLQCLEESMSMLLRNQVGKRTLVDNLDLLLLAIDEIVDDGVILENDPQMVVSRVSMKGQETDIPLAEQTFTQALQTARDQFIRSFR